MASTEQNSHALLVTTRPPSRPASSPSPANKGSLAAPAEPFSILWINQLLHLGFPAPKHEAEGKKLWENAKKLFGKPTVTICASSSPDSNLPAWAALHTPMLLGPGHFDLLTPSLTAVRLQEEAVVNTMFPPARLYHSELNQSSLCHQMRRIPQDRKEQTEKYSGEESKAMKPRTARDAGGRPEQSRPARGGALRKSSTKFACRNLQKRNPNELLILKPLLFLDLLFFSKLTELVQMA